MLFCFIKNIVCALTCGRRGGLIVSALNSRFGGAGALCSWARHFTLIVFLSRQVYKWLPVNLRLGVTLRSIPSGGGGGGEGGSRNTPICFMLRKSGQAPA